MENKKTIVRYEPYYAEWISIEDNGEIFSIEFEDDFKESDYPNVSFIKPDFIVDNACSVPIVVQILLTRKCNYNCINCNVHSSKNRDEMTTEEVKKIIEDCANAGVLLIRFSGGEATLRKDFVELVKYTKSLGLKCALLSNCKKFTKEQFDIMNELCYVQPHFDTPIEESFNKLTGGNNFKDFKTTLLDLINRGVRITPSTTLQRENVNQIKEMIDFCAENHIPLKITNLYGDAILNEQAWFEYYNDVILPFQDKWEELKQYASKVKCNVVSFVDRKEWEIEVKDTMAVISPWGRSYITIDCESNIIVYPLLLTKEFIIGSIKKGDNLFDVWKNSEVLYTLRTLTKEKLGCGNCRLDCVYCNPLFSYSYYGEFGKVLPHNNCPYRKFSTNLYKNG
jgi:MoaA/NifB/PqqE/SkfB family radical SAM enzyme